MGSLCTNFFHQPMTDEKLRVFCYGIPCHRYVVFDVGSCFVDTGVLTVEQFLPFLLVRNYIILEKLNLRNS